MTKKQYELPPSAAIGTVISIGNKNKELQLDCHVCGFDKNYIYKNEIINPHPKDQKGLRLLRNQRENIQRFGICERTFIKEEDLIK
jgi:hypothetical protein